MARTTVKREREREKKTTAWQSVEAKKRGNCD